MDRVSQIAVNRERDSRENSTGVIMRLDLYASDFRGVFYKWSCDARNDCHEK